MTPSFIVSEQPSFASTDNSLRKKPDVNTEMTCHPNEEAEWEDTSKKSHSR
jgi:hypothetical protein